MKIVVIEDETLNTEGLMYALKNINIPNQVIATLSSVKESVHFFKHNREQDYDIIFSDIKLGDGLCFDIFKQTSVTRPIIFCTAYNNYASDAFKNNGIDYILKPFDENAVERSLIKFLKLKETVMQNNAVANLAMQMKHHEKQETKSSVLVYKKDKIMPVAIDTIALFYIDAEVLKIVCFNGSTYSFSGNLDELENIYTPKFFRANRQFLINRAAVKEASKFFARKLLMHLNIPFSQQIIISKAKVAPFLSWLSDY